MKILVGIMLMMFMGFSAGVFAQPNRSSPPAAIVEARKLVSSSDWNGAISVLTEFTKENPGIKPGWALLGFSQPSVGKYKEAIISYERALAISKDPRNSYNLACSYARTKELDKAFEWLNSALKQGFSQVNTIKTDKDLANLRRDPRFKDVKAHVKRNSEPCMHSAEHRQFDFWVGEWNVFIRGTKVGENNVTIGNKGCSIVENWRSASGAIGKSLNVYIPWMKKWKQFYVGSNGGSPLENVGVYKDNVMKLKSSFTTSNGAKVMRIWKFHNLPDKTVRQHAQVSRDGGKTWITTWDAIYIRKKEKQ